MAASAAGYQGLDADRPPCDELQEGLSGVARGYRTEPTDAVGAQ